MMMTSGFVIWSAYADPKANFCVLDDLENVTHDWELKKGVSRADSFPEYAEFSMDEEYPKNIVLPDNVRNISALVIVSRSLKEFIEARQPKNLEYLPVCIFDHKGKVASRDHFILNPLGLQDCLDTERSGCRWSKVSPDAIADVKQVVIDDRRVDPDTMMFRMCYYTRPVVVRRELAEAVTGAGFTGLKWRDVQVVRSEP